MTTESPPVDASASIRLQAFGWFAVCVVYFVLDLPGQPEAIDTLALRALVWGAMGWLSSRLLLWVYARTRPAPRRVWTLVSGSVAGAVVGGLTWFALFTAVDFAVGLEPGFVPPTQWSASHVVAELITFVFPMLAWHGMALSLQHWAQLTAARAEAERAQRLAREAQLRMLRYQLNPHFLFNTLNSAIALVDVDGARAQTMLMQLCEVLRHTLRDRSPITTVRDELASIRDYLAIEAVRFEERLEVHEHIDETSVGRTIPPLLLHPLVDNAIRHGFEHETHVRIDIHARCEGDSLTLEVVNDGQLRASSRPGHGIGARNVRERLAASYPGRHSFVVEQDGPRVHARVVLKGSPAVEHAR
ncbi:MAG: histidine kinase [Deltaproteobacteria bacterium]|nr:histidine kinase [Deltaproteobacteria bacterium]